MEGEEMRVQEIMTKDPQCCTPDTTIQDVARMMVDCDCGAIPVVQEKESKQPVGVITDRDIVARTQFERNDEEATRKAREQARSLAVAPAKSPRFMSDRAASCSAADSGGRCG